MFVEADDHPEDALLDDSDNEALLMTEGELSDDIGAGPPAHRKKSTHVFLTDEQERMLGEWVQEHPLLFDRGCVDFKDAAKKNKLFEEKARTLEPPLTGKQLATWLRSIRTRYGRLTKFKSGQAARDLTAREKWILSVFSFFGKHIVRQKKTKTLGTKQVSLITVTLN